MKLDKAKLDKFLKAPDDSLGAMLFYGPDEGLAREYARAAQRAVLGAEDDPFRLAELTADQIKEDEARLTDELNAISMLGGRRVVRVAQAGNMIAAAIEAAIAAQAATGAALLIVEAGDIGSKAELVKVFEAAPRAGVMACYHDDDAKLAELIRGHLKAGGYAISRDALAYLAQRLGGDRAVTRGELDKLMLYVGPANSEGPKREINEQDAIACIGDRAAFALDDLIGAAADGDVIALDRNYTRSFAEVEAIQLLRAAARHFQRLHQITARMAAGEAFESAAAALRPPVFWTQRARMERQARLWPARRIGRALERLIEAEAQAMRNNQLKDEIAQRALLEIASLVRRPTDRPPGDRPSGDRRSA